MMTEARDAVPPTLCARLDAIALRNREAPALLDTGGVRATHGDLARCRAGVRDRLRDAGVGGHDRVAVAMPSDWRLAVVLPAVMSSCAAVVLAPSASDRELTGALSQVSARAVVTDPVSALRLRALVPAEIPVLTWTIDELDGETDHCGDPAPDDPALLLFTSGTTSVPRLADLSQRDVNA